MQRGDQEVGSVRGPTAAGRNERDAATSLWPLGRRLRRPHPPRRRIAPVGVSLDHHAHRRSATDCEFLAHQEQGTSRGPFLQKGRRVVDAGGGAALAGRPRRRRSSRFAQRRIPGAANGTPRLGRRSSSRFPRFFFFHIDLERRLARHVPCLT